MIDYRSKKQIMSLHYKEKEKILIASLVLKEETDEPGFFFVKARKNLFVQKAIAAIFLHNNLKGSFERFLSNF